MRTRRSGSGKERDRLWWTLENPPKFSFEDIQSILATCPQPLPIEPVPMLVYDTSDGQVGEATIVLGREEALLRGVKSCLNQFLIDRTLELDESTTSGCARFKVIAQAAERLQRALGLQFERDDAKLPWSIEKGFLQPMTRSARATTTAQTEFKNPIRQSAQTYLSELRNIKIKLNTALEGVALVTRWANASMRLKKSQSLHRKSRRDEALDRLIVSLAQIWVDILGQDLTLITKHNRNRGRWSPIPDSFHHFISFVCQCAKPLGIEFSREDMSYKSVTLFPRAHRSSFN